MKTKLMREEERADRMWPEVQKILRRVSARIQLERELMLHPWVRGETPAPQSIRKEGPTQRFICIGAPEVEVDNGADRLHEGLVALEEEHT